MRDSEFVILYSTFPDTDAAQACATMLVNEKLAACVNVLAPMTSVYRWQDKLETASEVGILIKTRLVLMDAVIAAARAQHPYELPCFLALPVEAGNADYLAWIAAQTRDGG